MKGSTVFVVYMHSLFAQGVVSLLKQQAGLEIVGMDNDPLRAIDHIQTLQPDVVIVDSNDGGEPFPVNFQKILKERQKVRVINLHFGDNGMDIYDGRQVYATQPEDLIEAIRTAVEEDDGWRG